jgi:hypothetical protein
MARSVRCCSVTSSADGSSSSPFPSPSSGPSCSVSRTGGPASRSWRALRRSALWRGCRGGGRSAGRCLRSCRRRATSSGQTSPACRRGFGSSEGSTSRSGNRPAGRTWPPETRNAGARWAAHSCVTLLPHGPAAPLPRAYHPPRRNSTTGTVLIMILMSWARLRRRRYSRSYWTFRRTSSRHPSYCWLICASPVMPGLARWRSW